MRFDSSYKTWLKPHDCIRRGVSYINFGLDLYVWFESKNCEKEEPDQMDWGYDFDI